VDEAAGAVHECPRSPAMIFILLQLVNSLLLLPSQHLLNTRYPSAPSTRNTARRAPASTGAGCAARSRRSGWATPIRQRPASSAARKPAPWSASRGGHGRGGRAAPHPSHFRRCGKPPAVQPDGHEEGGRGRAGNAHERERDMRPARLQRLGGEQPQPAGEQLRRLGQLGAQQLRRQIG
jgi:hypothetical protein